MDLNQFSTVDIVLDKANDNIIQKQTISAGDRDGRSLTLQVTDAGSIGEVPGLTANLLWTNHSSGVSDLSAFSVVDRLTSIFKINYPQNMLTAGKVTAQIQLLHNGKVTHSKKFEIIVLDVAGKLKGVLQKAEYTALVEALAKTNEFETDIAEVSAQLAQKADNSQIIDFQNQLDNIIADTGTPEAIGSELSQLRSDTFGNNFKTTKKRVDNAEKIYMDGQSIIETNWVQGSVLNNGTFDEIQPTLITTNGFFPVISSILKIDLDEAYQFAVSYYDDNKMFIKRTPFINGSFSVELEGSFYKVTFGTLGDSHITPDDSDIIKMSLTFNVYEKITGFTEKLLGIASRKIDITKPSLANGAIQQDGTINYFKKYYRTIDKYYLQPNSVVEISVIDGQQARINYFNSDNTIISVTDWKTGTFRETVKGDYFKVVVMDSEYTTARLNGLKISIVLPNLDGNASASVLLNKTLLNFGDSIAAASTTNVKGYQHQLSETYSMPLNSYALDGATVTETDKGTHNIMRQVNQAIASGITPDFVLFNGLTNDANLLNESEFGVITEGYNASLDVNTFCGAFEWLLKTIRNQWKQAKILYVRPHNMMSRDGRQVQLGNLAIEMCEKWGIPYVDLYRHSGFVIQSQEFVDLYCIPNDSGSHPNTLGYETFYVPQIKNKLENI